MRGLVTVSLYTLAALAMFSFFGSTKHIGKIKHNELVVPQNTLDRVVRARDNLKAFGEFQNEYKYQNPVVRINRVVPKKDLLSLLGSIFGIHPDYYVSACSGTVIDSHYILTAAHCLFNEKGQFAEGKYRIFVYGSDEALDASPAAMDISLDTGLLEGDFSSVRPSPISTDVFAAEEAPTFDCGYPMNNKKMVCDKVLGITSDLDRYVGHGHMMYGMSGGPLFQINTLQVQLMTGVVMPVQIPTVIGVNQAIADTVGYNVIFSNIIGLFADLGVDQ